MNKVLALDIGTCTGVYVEGSGKALTHCFERNDLRYSQFYDIVVGYIKKYKIKSIVYEDASFQKGNAVPVYHGFVGVLKLVASKYDIYLYSIPVKTVKKVFTGNANAEKSDMMNQCDLLGIKYQDDNSADAVAVYTVFRRLMETEDDV